jgi:hypothetical protein
MPRKKTPDGLLRLTGAQNRQRIWQQRIASASTPEEQMGIAFDYFRSALRHLRRRRFRGTAERVTRLAIAARLEREMTDWLGVKAEELDVRMREAGYDDAE